VNPLFDALAEEIGRRPETDTERRRWDRACRSLAKAGVEVDEVPSLVAHYRAMFRRAEVTPKALAANLSALRNGKHETVEEQVRRLGLE